MKKSLKNKLITGTAIAGFGLASLIGPMNSPVRAEDDRPTPSDFVRGIIEEATPFGIITDMLGGGKKETHIHIHPDKERNYQEPIYRERKRDYQEQEKTAHQRKMDELPLIFTCGLAFSPIQNCKEIGKQIFYTDEEIYIIGRASLSDFGEEIVNHTKCLTTGKKAKKIIPKKYIKEGYAEICILQANSLYSYYQKDRGIDTALYENTWYADGRKIGSVKFIVTKKSSLNKFSSKVTGPESIETPDKVNLPPTDERISHGDNKF